MRPRTLLLFVFAALLGAAIVVPPALAASSEEKLEINENCVEPNWPCWAAPGSSSPALKVTIAVGGEVMFTDHASTAATVVWTGSAPTMCSGIPASASTGWVGKCEFKTSGTYKFKSSTLFDGGGSENYTEYEVVVTGPPTPMATTEQATAVTETEATLNGKVDPEGQATSYYFEYGTTESYGTKTSEMPAGSGSTNQEFHFTWTGLSPNTTYYFQLVAVYGTSKTKVEGGNTTFKTAAPPGPPSASTPPPPNTPSPISSPIGGNPMAITSTTPPAPSQGATTGTPVTPTTTLSTEKAAKPLTRAQKLATALKQCKKQPKKKRAQCETNARKLYAPQHKSHKK